MKDNRQTDRQSVKDNDKWACEAFTYVLYSWKVQNMRRKYGNLAVVSPTSQ